jgi:photosystem II stability/assembly factor-like uncharacterized protein
MAGAPGLAHRSLLGISVVVALCMPGAAIAAQGRTERDNPLERMKYFYAQRAYPFERIPPNALRSARALYEARWPGVARLQSSAVGVSTAGWSSLGPTSIAGFLPAAGRVTALAIDPTNPMTIYVGAAQGGVWKSLNGGGSWAPLTDGQCSLAIGALAIDPVAPAIVYAGTGEANFSADSYYGCGVLRSSDGGATWSQLGRDIFDTPDGGATISRIIVDPATAGSATGSTIFAATSFGVYKSTNSGSTWIRVLSGYAPDLAQDPSNGLVLYAGGYLPSPGVYKTTDGGNTWRQLLGGFPTSNVGRTALAIAPSAPNVLYAAVASTADGTLLGIYKSDDSGATWGELDASNAACNGQCWYDLVIAVDPSNADVVYFGGVPLYKSVDGGANFTNIGGPIHVDQHAFAFDPGNSSTIYAGNDGGVYRSIDRGQAWVSLNTNLAITQFYPGISVAPTASRDILGGTQDNGTLEFTGSAIWTPAFSGDGGFTAINYLSPTTAFMECQWHCGPWRRDGGMRGSLVPASNGIDFNDRAQFIPPLVMDPVNPLVLYFGTYRLYRTEDDGQSWVAISPDLTKGYSGISAIAAAASDSLKLYVGTGDGNVQVTSDGGSSWKAVTGGLPDRYVTDIIVDPSNAGHAYVTFSGFTYYGGVAGHVFETADGGGTWRDITSNLLDLPVNAILRVPSTGELFVGTDLGAFRSADDGTTWAPWTPGLPNVAVLDLALSPVTGTIVAATHGRGMFEYAVTTPAVLRGDVNADGRVSALDAQGILTGVVGLSLPSGWVLDPNGDADCDGGVSALDAQIVLSYAVGLPTSQFCVGTAK